MRWAGGEREVSRRWAGGEQGDIYTGSDLWLATLGNWDTFPPVQFWIAVYSPWICLISYQLVRRYRLLVKKYNVAVVVAGSLPPHPFPGVGRHFSRRMRSLWPNKVFQSNMFAWVCIYFINNNKTFNGSITVMLYKCSKKAQFLPAGTNVCVSVVSKYDEVTQCTFRQYKVSDGWV